MHTTHTTTIVNKVKRCTKIYVSIQLIQYLNWTECEKKLWTVLCDGHRKNRSQFTHGKIVNMTIDNDILIDRYACYWLSDLNKWRSIEQIVAFHSLFVCVCVWVCAFVHMCVVSILKTNPFVIWKLTSFYRPLTMCDNWIAQTAEFSKMNKPDTLVRSNKFPIIVVVVKVQYSAYDELDHVDTLWFLPSYWEVEKEKNGCQKETENSFEFVAFRNIVSFEVAYIFISRLKQNWTDTQTHTWIRNISVFLFVLISKRNKKKTNVWK